MKRGADVQRERERERANGFTSFLNLTFYALYYIATHHTILSYQGDLHRRVCLCPYLLIAVRAASSSLMPSSLKIQVDISLSLYVSSSMCLYFCLCPCLSLYVSSSMCLYYCLCSCLSLYVSSSMCLYFCVSVSFIVRLSLDLCE